MGPKTHRLAANSDIELIACDYRGRITDPTIVRGKAAILSDTQADYANVARSGPTAQSSESS